jgi:proton glutamate symport protein
MRIPWRSLTFWIFVGLFAGLACGALFGERIVPLGDTMGTLFLRLLRMAIMPLIVASITSAVISVGSRQNLGILGAQTFGYYVVSSLAAILTGQILVNVLKPGVGSTLQLEREPEVIPAIEKGFGEILLDIIPENPFASLAEGNVLPVIFFSILLGYFITRIREPQRTQIGDLFAGLFEAMLRMTQMIVWTAPLGVFGINAKIVATTGFSAFQSLGFYFAVVLIGLAIHAFVTLPLALRVVTGRSPVRHYRGMPPALVTAFSTCSSIVTLPLTMRAVTEKSGVSRKIASFVLPIGATVNMDGTALYECVAVVFIAQVYGFDLTFTSQLLIVLTALLASIGAASVPMAGLVMMSIILSAVGLPLEAVGLIIAVDRFLDMFRTATNVLSDSVGTVVIAKLQGEDVLRDGPAPEDSLPPRHA